MQTINLDYDDTFTTDPIFWRRFAEDALNCGKTILCICARRESVESRKELEFAYPKGVLIYFTGHNPKKKFAEDRGIKVDIWIDNNPSALFESDNPELQVELCEN